MDDVNQNFLFPIWGSNVIKYHINFASHSMHFQLFAMSGDKTLKTQIDIENIRMFCYGTDECYNKGDNSDMFSDPSNRGPIPFSELTPQIPRDETWIEMTEIEAIKPGKANVKVYFNYSKSVPSPYFNADQNIVIDFPDAVLTVSAGKITINGICFVWSQEEGSFLRKRDSKDT